MSAIELYIAVCVGIGVVYSTVRLLFDDEMPNVIG